MPAAVSQHQAGPGASWPVAAYPALRQRAVMPRSRAGCTPSAAASRSYGTPPCSPHKISPSMSRCWIWMIAGPVAVAVIAARSCRRGGGAPACPPPGALGADSARPARRCRRRPPGRNQTVSTRAHAPLSPRTPLTPHVHGSVSGRLPVLVLTSACPTPWDRRVPAGGGPAGAGRAARGADAGPGPGAARVRAGRAPGGPGGGTATVRLVLHAIGGVISAAVVLAAFWAAVRLLAGRAFRRTAYPRRLLGPRRRGTVTLRLAAR